MSGVLVAIADLIYLYVFILFARVIMGYVLAFTQYRPSGFAAVAFELVYTVTDPPLRALRRVIPQLRIGNMGLDLSLIVLSLVLSIVAGQLVAAARG